MVGCTGTTARAVESPDGRHSWRLHGEPATREHVVNAWLREHYPTCPYPVRAAVYEAFGR